MRETDQHNLTRHLRKNFHRLEHNNFPKKLGGVLYGVFQALEHGLHPDRLFDPLLGFEIEVFYFKSVCFPLTFRFGIRLHSEELR